MGQRLDLHQILKNILGSEHVYFQPPSSHKMNYPCIVYSRDNASTEFADNIPYRISNRYQIMIIDQDPDSEIPGKIAMLPSCMIDRVFVTDNLNHYVYVLYF